MPPDLQEQWIEGAKKPDRASPVGCISRLVLTVPDAGHQPQAGLHNAYGETTKWAPEASEHRYRFHQRDGVEARRAIRGGKAHRSLLPGSNLAFGDA